MLSWECGNINIFGQSATKILCETDLMSYDGEVLEICSFIGHREIVKRELCLMPVDLIESYMGDDKQINLMESNYVRSQKEELL